VRWPQWPTGGRANGSRPTRARADRVRRRQRRATVENTVNEASTSPAKPTLSVCCVTNAPPAQVAAVFAPFREMADGFVIVFDDRVPPSWARAYEQLSSRCAPVTFEHLERHLTLGHELCTTDWVLRLDTDEVASPALLARLPALLADPAIQEYRIARRWLYRSPTTWLDEVPWTPDHQTRLVRRSPTLHFSGEVHSTADPREPAAYVEEPLYHLDCIVNDLTARRLKALWYEVLRPDLRAVGGLPMWSYYQPEDFARRPLAAVPEADRDAIAAMLRGGPDRPRHRSRASGHFRGRARAAGRRD
jgi:hypothetical protein